MVSFALGAASSIYPIKTSPIAAGTIISPLLMVVVVLLILIMAIAVLTLLKRISMKFLAIEKSLTWGCGYSHPTNRMQYTASSFADSILRIFRTVMGYSVAKGSSHVVEVCEEFIFRPVFQVIKFLSAKLKIIQCGYTQWYLLYIFVFLLFLLIWKMV
jgi:hydrogenase-4 component B